MAGRQVGQGVGAIGLPQRGHTRGMLPGVDRDTVQAAQGSKGKGGRRERDPEPRLLRDGRNKDRGGEEEADSDLLRQSPVTFCRMDHHEISDYKNAKHQIELNGGSGQGGQKKSEHACHQCHCHHKAEAMPIMKAMALLEFLCNL